jgi:hypothetical protein
MPKREPPTETSRGAEASWRRALDHLSSRAVVLSQPVSPPEILAELQKLADRLGVAVRIEPFDGKSARKGGLCKLRGAPFIVIDGGLPIMDKIGILSDALATFDLEAIYLPPVLRSRLEKGRGGRSARGPVRPPLRPMAKARMRGVR